MTDSYDFEEQIEGVYVDPILAEKDLAIYKEKFNRYAEIFIRDIQEQSQELSNWGSVNATNIPWPRFKDKKTIVDCRPKRENKK